MCQLIVSGLIVYMFYLCSVVLMCYSVSVLCSTRYYPPPSCPILASFYGFTTHATHMSNLGHSPRPIQSIVNFFFDRIIW